MISRPIKQHFENDVLLKSRREKLKMIVKENAKQKQQMKFASCSIVQIRKSPNNKQKSEIIKSQMIFKNKRVNSQKSLKNTPSLIYQKKQDSSKLLTSRSKKLLSIQQYMRQHDDKMLVLALRNQKPNIKQFRKRIITEARQYITLRNHMQKYKTKISPQNSQFQKYINKKEKSSSKKFNFFLNETRQKVQVKTERKHQHTQYLSIQ